MADNLAINGPHWQFSITIYDKAGVPSACLLLQERHRVDVNILLLGLYGASQQNIGFSEIEIEQMDAYAQAFKSNVVAPLRAARRWLKGTSFGMDGEAVRNSIKQTELQAEQLEQAIIANWVSALKHEQASPDLMVIAARIVNHFACQNGTQNDVTQDKATHEAIKTIVTAAMSTDGRS